MQILFCANGPKQPQKLSGLTKILERNLDIPLLALRIRWSPTTPNENAACTERRLAMTFSTNAHLPMVMCVCMKYPQWPDDGIYWLDIFWPLNGKKLFWKVHSTQKYWNILHHLASIAVFFIFPRGWVPSPYTYPSRRQPHSQSAFKAKSKPLLELNWTESIIRRKQSFEKVWSLSRTKLSSYAIVFEDLFASVCTFKLCSIRLLFL